jgi:hypothetical protein
VLAVQLYSGLRLLSTVPEPKRNAPRPASANWQQASGRDFTACRKIAPPRCTRPGSPHSKQRKLTPCAALPLNSAHQLLSTVQEPKRNTLAPLRRTGDKRQGATSQPAGKYRPPAAPGQVHPTASSVSSTACAALPLNSAHQLLSTARKPKRNYTPGWPGSRFLDPGLRVSATLLFCMRHDMGTALNSYSLRNPKTTAAPGQVHPTASSVSSHRALPLPLNSAHQLLSTVQEPKRNAPPPLSFGGKLAAGARTPLHNRAVSAAKWFRLWPLRDAAFPNRHFAGSPIARSIGVPAHSTVKSKESFPPCGAIAQSGRAPRSQRGGRRFEPD